MKLRISLLALAATLMAAHFLRTSSILPMLLCLAVPFLLYIKQRWALRVVQGFTVIFAFIWMITLYGIIQVRIFEHRSWTASAIILGVVATFTLVSGLLLNNSAVKEQYP